MVAAARGAGPCWLLRSSLLLGSMSAADWHGGLYLKAEKLEEDHLRLEAKHCCCIELQEMDSLDEQHLFELEEHEVLSACLRRVRAAAAGILADLSGTFLGDLRCDTGRYCPTARALAGSLGAKPIPGILSGAGAEQCLETRTLELGVTQNSTGEFSGISVGAGEAESLETFTLEMGVMQSSIGELLGTLVTGAGEEAQSLEHLTLETGVAQSSFELSGTVVTGVAAGAVMHAGANAHLNGEAFEVLQELAQHFGLKKVDVPVAKYGVNLGVMEVEAAERQSGRSRGFTKGFTKGHGKGEGAAAAGATSALGAAAPVALAVALQVVLDLRGSVAECF